MRRPCRCLFSAADVGVIGDDSERGLCDSPIMSMFMLGDGDMDTSCLMTAVGAYAGRPPGEQAMTLSVWKRSRNKDVGKNVQVASAIERLQLCIELLNTVMIVASVSKLIMYLRMT